MNNKQFPIGEVSKIAERESWRKEIYRPIYHIHKWWGQRLGSVFRAIILHLLDSVDDTWGAFYNMNSFNDITILDPFMGSGTTIGEALKLGIRAIGCDINPVSSFLVKQELTCVPLHELTRTYDLLERRVAHKILDFYKTLEEETKEEIPVLYYFWVKIVKTPDGEEIPLFKSYIFAKNAYTSKKPCVQIICPECWKIFQGVYNQTEAICPLCGNKFNPQSGSIANNTVKAKNGTVYRIKDLIPSNGEKLLERMYALLAINHKGEKVYQSIQEFDQELYEKAIKKLALSNISVPTYPVYSGFNTDQARGYNYLYWSDFFNKRQLYCLGILLDEILKIEETEIREQFLCLFSSTLEFNNTFCSYKGEGTGAVRPIFSNHILKPERMPLENSVWGYSSSSGCFSSLFRSRLLKAKQYLDSPFDIKIDENTEKSIKVLTSRKINPSICTRWDDFIAQDNPVLILNGDSSTLPIPDASVDLVVTDPPYFDFIHYSELSDFFYAWLSPILKDKYLYFNIETSSRENEVQQTDASAFSVLLGNVFSEIKRVLKAGGKLAFSFHHSKFEGWLAIVNALKYSKLYVVDTFPIFAEFMASTPKASTKEPISVDAIIICSLNQTNTESKDIVPMALKYAKLINEKNTKKLSKSDIFVISCSQCLQECTNKPLSNEIMIELMNSTYKSVLEEL